MNRYVLPLFAVLLVAAPAARAQFPAANAPGAVPGVVADALQGDLKRMAEWYKRGFYDDIVRRADELIGDETAPDFPLASRDGRLLFWRGKAFQRLGWLPEAAGDLEAARAAGVTEQAGVGSVASSLERIARLQALAPPRYLEVRNGNDVVFRVYYTSENPLTRGIIAALPNAYRISRAMFGTDVLATPVYIFDGYPQFRAFYTERSGRPPGSWVAAAGSLDGFYFSLQRPDGTGAAERDPDHLRATIPHEFNHAMLHHLMGTTALPRWFEEGLAQVAGGQVVARDEPLNDYTIARLFAVGSLVPPAQLEKPDNFGSHTEVGAKLGREGASIIAPSPYAQGYHMTRYLLGNLRRGQLRDFLNRVRDLGDFDAAFAEEFGVTLPQFYQSWYNDTARKVR